MFKFYKVNPSLFDLKHAEYVYDNYKYDFIQVCNHNIVKIDSITKEIFDLNDRNIPSFARNINEDVPLALSFTHSQYFEEIDEPFDVEEDTPKYLVIDIQSENLCDIVGVLGNHVVIHKMVSSI